MSVTSSVGRRCAVVILTALAAVLAVAAPAQAKIPSGAGWSASWRYYDPQGIDYKVTLPGVSVQGQIRDDANGTRNIIGELRDEQPADSFCARAVAVAPGVAVIDDVTTCAGAVFFGDATLHEYEHVYVFVYQMYTFGGADPYRQNYLVVPPSSSDPGLRTPGTGASWAYASASTYSYEVRRPSVRVSGTGHHEQSSDGRTAYSTVERLTSSLFGCSSGSTKANKIVKPASTCAPNGVAHIAHNDIQSAFTVEACVTNLVGPKRCLSTTVAEPT